MTLEQFFWLFVGVWALVSFVAAGIIVEKHGKVSEHEVTMLLSWPFRLAFWVPVGAIYLVGYGVIWSLLWLGRGPVRIARWLKRPKAQSAIPEARTVQR